MPKEIEAEYRKHITKEGKEIDSIYINGKLTRPLSGYPKIRRASASHIMELKEYYGFYLWLIQIAPDSGENEGVIDIPINAIEKLIPWEKKWIKRALHRLHNHPKTYILYYPAQNQFTSVSRIILPKYSAKTWIKYKSLIETKKMLATKSLKQTECLAQKVPGTEPKCPQHLTKMSPALTKKSLALAATSLNSKGCSALKPLYKPIYKPYLSLIYSQKKSFNKKNISKIFNHWNGKGIVKHREIERFKSPIKARLKNYSSDEIIQAIDNYDQILKSPDYYWTHKYDLCKFLKPGNIDRFLSENNPFDNYKSNSYKGKQNDQAGTKQNIYKYCNKPESEYLKGTIFDPGLKKEKEKEKEDEK